jgi:hypothetical protein
MTLNINFKCQRCGAADDNEAVVKIDTASSSGNYSGLPENCYPGEAAEWHIEGFPICGVCSFVQDIDKMYADSDFDTAVQEREAESHYNDDPDEPDIDEWGRDDIDWDIEG